MQNSVLNLNVNVPRSLIGKQFGLAYKYDRDGNFWQRMCVQAESETAEIDATRGENYRGIVSWKNNSRLRGLIPRKSSFSRNDREINLANREQERILLSRLDTILYYRLENAMRATGSEERVGNRTKVSGCSRNKSRFFKQDA